MEELTLGVSGVSKRVGVSEEEARESCRGGRKIGGMEAEEQVAGLPKKEKSR